MRTSARTSTECTPTIVPVETNLLDAQLCQVIFKIMGPPAPLCCRPASSFSPLKESVHRSVGCDKLRHVLVQMMTGGYRQVAR